MADVAFLLIIYFMVAWTFTATRGLDLGLPDQETSKPIETVESQRPDKPVIVMTDPDAPYGRTVDVLDELRQGATRLGLESEIVIAVPTYREAEAYWR